MDKSLNVKTSKPRNDRGEAEIESLRSGFRVKPGMTMGNAKITV